MRRSDRSRCPQCGTRVTPFAAGCAICGADLDIRRFDKQPRFDPAQWITRGAIVAAIVAFCYLAATSVGGPRAMQPSHVLGAPFALQGPPLDELVYYLRGGNNNVPITPGIYSKGERRDPRRWVLLAQIEEQGGLTIADGGVLYYAIPRRDLAVRRFDRVAVIMQSH